MAGRSRSARSAPACGSLSTRSPSPRRPASRPPGPGAPEATPRPPEPCTRRARRRPRARLLRSPRRTGRSAPPALARSARRGRGLRPAEARSAECRAELLEEAAVRPVVAVVLGALEVLQETALLVREVARDGDVHEHAVVAAAAALQHRHAPPAQHADLAGLRARLELELGVAVEGVDGHRGAERGLRHGEVDGGHDVVAVTHEARVAPHVDLHVDVARPPAEGACVALAREADPLAVVDPSGDVDVQLTLLGHPPGACAVRARGLDDLAGASATRATLRPDELAEDGARDRLQPAEPLAGRAGRRRGSGGGARSGADGAADDDREGHAAANALRRLDELHLDLGEHVGAARRSPARPAAEATEEVVPEEGREEVGEVPEVELGRPETTGSEALVTVTVVELSRLRLREHLVRLRSLAK